MGNLVEVRHDFASLREWEIYCVETGQIPSNAVLLEAIKRHGVMVPVMRQQVSPESLRINENNLRESLSDTWTSSRIRAVLMAWEDLILHEPCFADKQLKIYATEALTRFAHLLKDRFPGFVGSEFLPAEPEQEKYRSIPHQDIMSLTWPEESFNMVLCLETLEHVPDPDQALTEFFRVLRQDGVLFATFPFHNKQEKSQVRAFINGEGLVEHRLPPQYHDNPARPNEGALVFETFGWDILERARRAGFEEVRMTLHRSVRSGILGGEQGGNLVFSARKSSRRKTSARSIGDWSCHVAAPGIMGLVGLPRSGTTLVTGMLDAHSRIQGIFEPWNSARKSSPLLQTTIDGFYSQFGLDPQDDRMLLIKETTTSMDYLYGVESVLDDARWPLERQFIWLIRNPLHVYLSEMQARRDWWGEPNITHSDSLFQEWAKKTLRSLKELSRVCRKFDGIIVSYEAVVKNPMLLDKVLSPVGLAFENDMINYHLSLDKSKVRGDQNVEKSATAPTVEKMQRRSLELQEIFQVLERSSLYPTILRLAEWNERFVQVGTAKSCESLYLDLVGIIEDR